MKLPTILISSLSLMLALSANNLYADTSGEAAAKPAIPEHEEHGPHEHGTGRLSIAQRDKEIEVSLDSPGMNLFGFEYLPKSAADKQVVADGEAKLWVGTNLFAFDADAGCKQTAAKLSNAAEKPDAAEAAADKGEVHSDVEASWTFTCEQPEALQTVSTKLFSTFSGFHKLNAEWVTDKGASAVELDKDDTIKLAP
jgi:hypothetical protein